MPQGEGSVVEGSGTQTDPVARWGDYTAMHIDHSDIAFFPDAVLLNATVVGQVGPGYLTVYGYGSGRNRSAVAPAAAGGTIERNISASAIKPASSVT